MLFWWVRRIMKLMIFVISFLVYATSVQAQTAIELMEGAKFDSFSKTQKGYQKLVLPDEEGSGGHSSADVAQPTPERTETDKNSGMNPDSMGMVPQLTTSPSSPFGGGSAAPINPNVNTNNPLSPPPNMSEAEMADYNQAVERMKQRYSGEKLSNEALNDAFGEIERIQTKHKPK